MNSGSRRKTIDTVLKVALAVLVFTLPLWIKNPTYMQILIFMLLYAYLTTSWNLVGGFAGVLPLGHSAYVGIGAYTSTILWITWGVSPWLGMWVGAFIAAVVGTIIGIPTLKLRGAYFALSTMAFGEGVRVLAENTVKVGPCVVGGPQGICLPLVPGNNLALFQFVSKTPYYYIILIMLCIALFITWHISRIRPGYYLAAGGEEPEAAEALGVNVSKYKVWAMALSCFMTALGGTFLAQLTLYFYPKQILGLDFSFELAFIALIGGRGTIAGPVIGALLLRPVSEFTRIYLSSVLPGLHLVIFGAILILVMIYQPFGLVRPLSRFYDRMLDALSGEKKKER
ncbi:MAG TPA: branched-chain amino acid ABC transporter permease [Deltaproteobacteria bacterium]|nr:branched-chain amino acid ABC transporter permease [Deltaproteobacteria bacterium]HPP79883.1 branched-chain amino acid ABC transporter permease [Deltaproteobacteria bacterium]